DVLVEDGFDVGLHLCLGVRLDIAALDQRVDHLGRNLRHARAVEPHGRVVPFGPPQRQAISQKLPNDAWRAEAWTSNPAASRFGSRFGFLRFSWIFWRRAASGGTPPRAAEPCRRRGSRRSPHWRLRCRRRAAETRTACTRSARAS